MVKMKSLSFTALIIALLFSLAACGGGNNETSQPSDSGSTSQPTASAATESPSASASAPAEETYDLGGREIRLASWGEGPKADTPEGQKILERVAEVEKKYNVKITYVNQDWGTYAEKFTTSVMAGEPFADVVYLPANLPLTMIKGGYLTALDDFMNVKEETKLSDQIIEAGSYGTGKTYGFLTAPPLFDNTGLLYNKRMLADAGLPTPEEYIKKGEWNWDTFVEVLKKLTISKSGNGEIDQWGLTGAPHSVGYPLIYSNGGVLYDEATQKAAVDSPEAIEALEFENKLYNEYKVFKRDEGNDWEDPARYFVEGKVGFYPVQLFEVPPRFLDKMADGYGFVPWPMGPKATDYVMGQPQMHVNVIPRGVKDPKMVYKIWEDLQFFDTIEEDNRVIAESWFSDEDSVNEALNTYKIMKFARYSGLGVDELMRPLLKDIVDGKVTPAAGVAQALPVIQASIDKALQGN
ncbi:ABC transporter substrate-binding protein [Cohnella yongneupensis]|uniref:ABC transporter substrate-binding protein n=1 Tax=Cohnella yongneupensis TaxID=425006 RepID=A0ABW0QWX6_9BACL